MLTLVALMVLVLGGAAAWYILQGPFPFWDLSVESAPKSVEWANFGTFLGGVAGPALTTLTGIVVALGFILQADSLTHTFNQSGMTASHASLAWARQRLDEVLHREVGSTGVTLQTLVIAHAQGRQTPLAANESDELEKLLPDMVYWLGPCVEQVKLFQSNQDVYGFTLQHELRFYGDVLKFVNAHCKKLPGMLPVTVGLIGALHKSA